MSQILTQAEVDALLAAVLDESLPNNAKPAVTPPTQSHDFLKSNHNIAKKLPVLDEVGSSFSKQLRSHLTDSMHKPANVKISTQTTSVYGDWIRGLSFPPCVGVAEIGLSGKAVAVSVEASLIYGILEQLYGNVREAPKPVEARDFSRVEINIANRFINECFACLDKSWSRVGDFRLNNVHLETHTQDMFFCSNNDLIFTQSFQVNVGESNGRIRVVYPFASLDYIKKHLTNAHSEEVSPFQNDIISHVAQTHVEVKAMLQDSQMKLSEILALKPGKTLSLNTKANAVNLFVEGQKKFEATLGQQQGRHVVRIK